MSDDKIYDAENPTSGLFQAQAAIEDILTPPEEKVEDSETRVDESSEEALVEGEAELETEVEESEQEFDAEEDDAELDDDEYEPEEHQAAEAYTVKVNGEEVEVELDELKNGYSRQADYTQKSQALAEEKKTFEQARNAIVLERRQYAQLLGALQQQLNANNEPAPNFDRMYDEDPIEATQQQQMHELITAEVERLPEVIPEWKDQERAGKEREQLREYLLENGVAEDEMQALVRANHIKVLRKAMLYDQGQSRVKKATRKASGSKTVKPGSRQGQVAPRSRKLKRARQRLKETGRLDDAAGLLESML